MYVFVIEFENREFFVFWWLEHDFSPPFNDK